MIHSCQGCDRTPRIMAFRLFSNEDMAQRKAGPDAREAWPDDHHARA